MNEELEGIMADGKLEAASEAALRAALRPEEPPADFAARILARVGRQGEQPSRESRRENETIADRRPGPMSMQAHFAKAAVLLLAVIVPLGWRLHHQSELARGEAAKQQVLLALRITGTQLRSIQERTQSIHAGSMPKGDSQ